MGLPQPNFVLKDRLFVDESTGISLFVRSTKELDTVAFDILDPNVEAGGSLKLIGQVLYKEPDGTLSVQQTSGASFAGFIVTRLNDEITSYLQRTGVSLADLHRYLAPALQMAGGDYLGLAQDQVTIKFELAQFQGHNA